MAGTEIAIVNETETAENAAETVAIARRVAAVESATAGTAAEAAVAVAAEVASAADPPAGENRSFFLFCARMSKMLCVSVADLQTP